METASDAILGIGKELGTELENQLPRLNNIYNQLLEVKSQFGNINDVVNLAGDGAYKLKTLISDIQKNIPLINITLENSQNLGSNLESFLTTSKNNLNNIAPVIKNDIKIINEISNEVSKNVNALISAINSGSEYAPQIVDSILGKLSSLNTSAESLINIIKTMNKFNPGKLDDILETLANVQGAINKAITGESGRTSAGRYAG